MTNSDLIKRLQQLPPEALVMSVRHTMDERQHFKFVTGAYREERSPDRDVEEIDEGYVVLVLGDDCEEPDEEPS